MTQADRPASEGDRLRVGLIADADAIQVMVPALKNPHLAVVAQAGKRPAESPPGVQWYDDVRVMLAQSGIQALLLATSPRAATELTAMALDHSLPVWVFPPLARTFDRAVELARRVRQAGPVIRIASWWDAVGDDVRWAMARTEGFQPSFTHIRVSAAGPSVQSWRASLADAPGGVLATDAYDLLESLIAVRGLPQRVSAAVANVRRRPGEAPRETEDVATAILRYEGAGVAVVQGTWDIPPYGWTMEHHGTKVSIALDAQRVAVRAADGEVLHDRPVDTEHYVQHEIDRFVRSVRAGEPPSAQDAAWERHLAVTALLQTIYLAARTGQPESPFKFYEVQGWPEPRR